MTSLFALPAMADINIGITVSATGPAAALGQPQRNTVPLLPDTIAGQKAGRETGCGPDRCFGDACGTATYDAGRARLQGPDLPDAWRDRA